MMHTLYGWIREINQLQLNWIISINENLEICKTVFPAQILRQYIILIKKNWKCYCSVVHPHPPPLDVSHGRVSWLKVAIATHSLSCVSQLPYVVLFSLRLENPQLTSDQAFPDVITLLPWLMCSAFLSVSKWVKLDLDKSSVPPGSLFDVSGCWTATGWVWEGSSLAGPRPVTVAPLPGERLPALGNPPAGRQLRLYTDLMKTLPPPLFGFPALMLCQPVPPDLVTPSACSQHFGLIWV